MLIYKNIINLIINFNIMKLIKKTDFFAYKVSLTINKKGENGYKTFIGGVISIISIILSLICGVYFLQRMFLRKDISLIFSNQINPFKNITYSHKLPFLLRLTDTNSLPFEEDDKLYYVTASVWYGGTNDTNISYSAKQTSVSLNIGKCDIDKHFAEEFREYFINFPELNKYYCITPRNSSQTIYGLYGNVYPFSYYSFTVRKCLNSTENNNICYSNDEILDIMQQPYLDVIFIDYSINSLNKHEVKELIVRKERYEISSTIYKRIWLYFDYIKYITDYGYIFPNEQIEYFHSYDSVRIDMNYYPFSNALVTLTVLNNGKNSIYNKQYTKAQDYLAIIGGLIKMITVFCTILNYYNSKNSFYLKIIKDYLKENKNPEKYSIHKNNPINNIIPTVAGKSKSNLESSIEIFTKNNPAFPSNKKRSINKIQPNLGVLSKALSIKILPSVLINKKTTQTFNLYKEFINDRLNVINIIKTMELITLNYNNGQKRITNLNELNESFKQINKKSNFVDG